MFLTFSVSSAVYADPTAPLFAGSTLTIEGITYTWAFGTEDEGGENPSRVDHYTTEGSGNITVTGLLQNTNLAIVSNSGGSTTINGYVQNGTYNHTYAAHTTGGSYNFNGRDYSWVSGGTTYSVDLMVGTVTAASISNTYEGIYEGTTVGFTVTTDGTGMTGSVSGTENGYVVDGNMLVNTYGDSGQQSNIGAESWFGGFYSSGGTYSTIYEYYGGGNINPVYYWTDYFSGYDGGSMSLSYNPYGFPYTLSISGWDPYIGDFSGFWADYQVLWNPRTGPTFAPAQLWVNGVLVVWHSGTLTSNGVVVDQYSGSPPQGGAILLDISGEVRGYKSSGQSATVTVDGTVGTSIQEGEGYAFNVSGYDIQSANPNRSNPLFGGSSLWLNGTEYVFTGGYEVSSTNTRTDTYENQSAGSFTIVGPADAPISGTVTGSHYGVSFSGTYDGEGTFSSGTVEIHGYPPVDGAPAVWVNGIFYTRASPYSNTYNGASGAALTLSGPSGANLTISGNDGTAAFDGAYPLEGTGLFFLSREGASIPACPANLNGTLLLSSQVPPEGLPPAVSIPGYGILQFVGNAAVNETTVAYYMDAAFGPQQNNILLSINTYSGAVELRNFATSTTLLGSYRFDSHLFQTGTEQGLPVPMFGVDPTSNNAAWGLLSPPEGRSSTLIVGGEIWRYAGTDQNGSAFYLGYFNGQKLTMAASPGSDGLVAVFVTDPNGGNSTGTYNDARKTFAMDNSLTVYRGDLEGERIIDIPGESDNLYTITADLDITGNLLSLGSLSTDASFAGVTFEFIDDGITATLSSALARPSAEWLWSRVSSSSSSEAAPMMKLDSAHRLNLYDPGSPAVPGIVLNPAVDGTSRFKGSVSVEGVLRVRPAGDLQMGEFQNGPQP